MNPVRAKGESRETISRREDNPMKIFRSLGFIALIVFGLASVVFAVVRWVPSGEYPGSAFFDLAAQTIPILLVALAVEAQARQFDLEKSWKRLRIAAVILLAFGQTAAVLVSASLYIPEYGVQSDMLVAVTAAGLLGGFFAVIAIAVRTTSAAISAPAAAPIEAEPTVPSRRSQDVERTRSAVISVLASMLMAVIVARASRPR
jgi:hypothetical protein